MATHPLTAPWNAPKLCADAEALGLTDPTPEAAFDGLTRLARRLCRAPMSVFTAIDPARDRQVFKARGGRTTRRRRRR